MQGLLQDLRYALRTLGRSPGFTAIAIITLGMGIGAGTAGFSLLNWILPRPVPGVRDASVAFLAAAVLLCVSVLLASWIPARRAAQVDPMTALRYE